MAVYERSYQPYTGDVTPSRSRFLILPRYAYREVFASRGFLAFYVVCFVVPVAVALLIYLPHNLRFLELIGAGATGLPELFRFEGSFFLYFFMIPQGTLSLFLVLLVGPPLVSADLRNNGLALYLSRPFSRSEYVLGKMAVLVILLSLITWIPGLLLFALQSYLGGSAWLGGHWRIGSALFFGSLIWILILCLLTLALSAYLKWKPVIRLALFAVFFVASVVSETINWAFKTDWGSVIDVLEMVRVIWLQLFEVSGWVRVPTWAAWLSLLVTCAVCLWMLARKVRPYEVVR